jgi:hypothetical protein
MKLRIQDDSLRLRLTRREVLEVRESGRVEAVIHFPDGAALTYAVEVSPDSVTLSAELDESGIRVSCPPERVIAWADGDQVSMESDEGLPHVLVEKDFECLHRPGERSGDGFPNPVAIVNN